MKPDDFKAQNLEKQPALCFEYRFINYEYIYERETFTPILFNTELPYAELSNRYKNGINKEDDYKLALLKYGPCTINVPIKPIPVLLVTEILNPFYIF